MICFSAMILQARVTKSKKLWNTCLKRHLLQFSSNTSPVHICEADLSNTNTINILAWVVSKFVPLLTNDPKGAFAKVRNKESIADYVTPGDIAFAVLVLEHHMTKWNKVVDFLLETGRKNMSVEFVRTLDGLLYKDGIAGEEAKRRFQGLRVYFFLNFYSGINDSNQRMNSLQSMVDIGADFESKELGEMISQYDKRAKKFPALATVQSDIAHRIFYYMHQ